MSDSLPRRGNKEILDALYLDLSGEDQRESYPALTNYFSRLIYQEDELRLAELFASPLYSDACKRYFAATHIRSEFILLLGDSFLSEEIILNHIETLQAGWERTNYLQMMLGSSHLSERLMEVALLSSSGYGWRPKLDIIPDAMITPKVVSSWMAALLHWDTFVPDWAEAPLQAAAARIKQLHPEYEEFPDEWALKVFCGK